MSFNPMSSLKDYINQSAETIYQSYDQISSEVATAITPIVKSVKTNINTEQQIQFEQPKKQQQQIKMGQEKIQSSNNLLPFEKKFENMYIGCFSDDPSNPSMDKYLGQVSNIYECIKMGQENNYDYVGIRGGSECFASNSIPTTQSVDKTKYCNVGCDEIGTGKCGGFFYNQVYKTTVPNNLPKLRNTEIYEQENSDMSSNAISILENFISTDADIKKISMGLNIDNFNCWKPMNTFLIFFWLIILLLLIYLLFEYLYKKNNENLI